jgi:hypothetical protein
MVTRRRCGQGLSTKYDLVETSSRNQMCYWHQISHQRCTTMVHHDDLQHELFSPLPAHARLTRRSCAPALATRGRRCSLARQCVCTSVFNANTSHTIRGHPCNLLGVQTVCCTATLRENAFAKFELNACTCVRPLPRRGLFYFFEGSEQNAVTQISMVPRICRLA